MTLRRKRHGVGVVGVRVCPPRHPLHHCPRSEGYWLLGEVVVEGQKHPCHHDLWKRVGHHPRLMLLLLLLPPLPWSEWVGEGGVQ